MRITEKKRVRFNDDCVENPVFLTWLNKFGVWQVWLFSRTQIIEFVTGNETSFENPVNDIEIAESFVEVLTLQAGKGMLLGADNLDRNDIEYVKTILFNPRVQLLTNPEDWQTEGAKWITVRPGRGSFPLIETGEPRADISMEIIFPRINLQSQ